MEIKRNIADKQSSKWQLKQRKKRQSQFATNFNGNEACNNSRVDNAIMASVKAVK